MFKESAGDQLDQAKPDLHRLALHLRDLGPVAIAVSGGVDSVTLGLAAAQSVLDRVEFFHASSPAVPAATTHWLEAFAVSQGWSLTIVRPDELADPAYRRNPHNRCFFCKSNLYAAIREVTDATILSGTNADDLLDFRPGLHAAATFGVQHPLADLGICKADVRRLCDHLGHPDVAEFPSQPCLASRIETGVVVSARSLSFVEVAEELIRDMSTARDIRCRVRGNGVVIELDGPTLWRMDTEDESRIVGAVQSVADSFGMAEVLGLSAYSPGSAVLHDFAQVADSEIG